MRTPKAKPSQKFPAHTHTVHAEDKETHTHTHTHLENSHTKDTRIIFFHLSSLTDFQLLILFEALKRVCKTEGESIRVRNQRVGGGCLLQSFVQNYAAQTSTIHLQIEQFNLLPLCPADILFGLKSCTTKVTTVKQKVWRGRQRREVVPVPASGSHMPALTHARTPRHTPSLSSRDCFMCSLLYGWKIEAPPEKNKAPPLRLQ